MAIKNTHLPKRVESVEAPSQAGKPIAQPVRQPGSIKGKIKILAGFSDLDKNIVALFRA
jgi:hypothetical protein